MPDIHSDCNTTDARLSDNASKKLGESMSHIRPERPIHLPQTGCCQAFWQPVHRWSQFLSAISVSKKRRLILESGPQWGWSLAVHGGLKPWSHSVSLFPRSSFCQAMQCRDSNQGFLLCQTGLLIRLPFCFVHQILPGIGCAVLCGLPSPVSTKINVLSNKKVTVPWHNSWQEKKKKKKKNLRFLSNCFKNETCTDGLQTWLEKPADIFRTTPDSFPFRTEPLNEQKDTNTAVLIEVNLLEYAVTLTFFCATKNDWDQAHRPLQHCFLSGTLQSHPEPEKWAQTTELLSIQSRCSSDAGRFPLPLSSGVLFRRGRPNVNLKLELICFCKRNFWRRA